MELTKYKHNVLKVKARQHIKDIYNRDLMRFIQILDRCLWENMIND